MECLKDLIKFMTTNKEAVPLPLTKTQNRSKIAFYDGANCDKKRRTWVKDYLEKYVPQAEVMFIESICNNENVISYNIQKSKVSLSDFFGISPEQVASPQATIF
jgi:hypothetical protein